MEHHIRIKYGQNGLTACLHYPTIEGEGSRESRHPAVIICHGFVGSRIGANRLFVKAARALAEQGYVVLRFDYAGCGESAGDYGATGMQDWIEQTKLAMDYVYDLDFIDPNRLTLLGHSLGGATALLTAVQDKRVRKLVMWAPVGHPFQDIVRIVGSKAYEEAVTAGATKYAGYELSHSFFLSLAPHHPLQEARKFAGDVFIVHGTADDSIPADYCFLYQKVFWTRGKGHCEKEILMQADHTFSTGSHAELAIQKTLDWLERMEKEKDAWYGWSI